jgi:hypothetical protein
MLGAARLRGEIRAAWRNLPFILPHSERQACDGNCYLWFVTLNAMKKINIIYWISTGLFGAFMFSTALPNLWMSPDSVALITDQLGYPKYIIPFLGVGKILGVIGLLIPGFPRLKEWAYAGLFFDLVGAMYSAIYVGGLDPAMLFMILPFGLMALSYIYHHKRESLKVTARYQVA